MLSWLCLNGGSLLVAALLAVTVFVIVRKLVCDKRAGRHCCGGNCSACRACSGACGGCSKP